MHDVSIAIPKKAGAGNHAEPPDKNAEYVSLRHLNMYLIFFRFSRKLKKMQNNIYPTLPNSLMSKNWIPMAKDFSSEDTDLKEKKNVLLLYAV